MFLEISNPSAQHPPQAVPVNAAGPEADPQSDVVPVEQNPKFDLASHTRQLGVVLHDLCQPLTTLQCRLEMAEIMDTDADYREAVRLSLIECARLSTCVTQMREVLRSLAP